MDEPATHLLEQQHDRAAIAERLATRRRSSISDWVLGAIDGAITTFAIVAGVLGASLSAGTVVVLGVANLLADGLSMAAGRYLGARADVERREIARRDEKRHIEAVPTGEREEVRQILAARGFEGADLEHAVEVITGNDETWVDFMLTEELGFAPDAERPLGAAAATFVGFVVFGALPISPFVLDATSVDVAGAGAWSAALTALAFLAIGALKGQVVGLSRVTSALKTLAIGGIAAGVAFLVGFLLQDLA